MHLFLIAQGTESGQNPPPSSPRSAGGVGESALPPSGEGHSLVATQEPTGPRVDGGSSSLPLPVLDLVGLGLILFLVVLGLWRGLWWQVIRLAGVLFAVLLARAVTPEVDAWLGTQWPEIDTRLRYGIGWSLVFLVALGGATILGVLGQRMIEAMQLGFANRMGGGFLGAATGVILHLALVLGLLQMAPRSFVQDAVADTYSEDLVDLVEEHIGELIDDPSVQAEVRTLLDEAPPRTPEGAERLLPEQAVEDELPVHEVRSSDDSRPRVR